MISKITAGKTNHLFTKKILGKYDVNYYKCLDTGFIQTEPPYWIEEAYSSAITKLDVGLVLRNQNLSTIAERLIINYFLPNGKYLDFAGGYGLFTRMMRDKGFDFYNTDKFCQNIFAEFQDLKSLAVDTKFSAVTAFEVFEHLEDPYESINEMLDKSKTLFFTTEIVPTNENELDNWWYLSLETGQHIALYTIKSLEFIAKKYNKYFYTNGKWLHLFTDQKLEKNPFDYLTFQPHESYIIKKIKRVLRRFEIKNNLINANSNISLIEKDWLEAKKIISNS